ncbi:Amidophosphoribosyltransferase precursor [Slackia heliotrinireducens]|uniref:Amidophosphoribosyltransferase n=1 Tax=Slackia heliotrinireducens (strain ATCC 29202 / DSM 20476 / NCTC 11029 / RHS 1) TaxID=471855 RepID=C7N3V1_SLAHD|nr:amidophosphoribosyltransferase [Slackia heliotrinireducens]ACV21692.1 amidophosphoribosyltransferase [Slackia heliotrinireducens DSM 20476]VEG99323.1 Amidophosphoribosyltransferase precursor [Slackia heliotrinireducens]
MGGFFGAASHRDVVLDVFFGVDYHSHLGTRRAGMVFCDETGGGFQKEIHSIENTPFRTRFEADLPNFHGNSGIGCISDTDPQPLLIRSQLGTFALTTVGAIGNTEQLIQKYLDKEGTQFMALSSGNVNSTELVAALINQKDSFVEGIKFAQDCVEGSLTLLIMTSEGEIIAARDKMGRLPILIGKDEDGYCVSFESFAYGKLGYEDEYELGSGEIVSIKADGYTTLAPAHDEMKICAFLWVYYGYPNSNYEGVNVEVMRYRNGEIMARDEQERGLLPDVDYVAGVPDSGLPHGIGYATESGKPFARPFVKYTPTWPRSFMPANQNVRNRVAKMKQIPVPELIKDKKLLFVDDSIVRGTQLRETVDFLYGAGAAEVHMRSACPPIMYGCKYLSFSRSNSDYELLARRVVRELEGDEGEKHLEEYADGTTERGKCMLKTICEEMGFDSLSYQSLDGMLEAIGIDPSKVCTYCWNGKE